MKRAAVAVTLLLFLAGCSHDKPAPPAPPPPPADQFLVDERGDAPARWDITQANFTELNGSLALRVTIRNYAEGLPLVTAILDTSEGTHMVRLVYDPTKQQSPQVKAEAGRFEDGSLTEEYEACWLPNFPNDPESEEPWWIFLEFLHNRTGLQAGGQVRGLQLSTSDVGDEDPKDSADAEGEHAVAGGENPYTARDPSCPLFHERERLY